MKTEARIREHMEQTIIQRHENDLARARTSTYNSRRYEQLQLASRGIELAIIQATLEWVLSEWDAPE